MTLFILFPTPTWARVVATNFAAVEDWLLRSCLLIGLGFTATRKLLKILLSALILHILWQSFHRGLRLG